MILQVAHATKQAARAFYRSLLKREFQAAGGSGRWSPTQSLYAQNMQALRAAPIIARRANDLIHNSPSGAGFGHTMKKTLIAGAALLALGTGVAGAADMPLKAPPAPVYAPPIFTWTGFYIGGNIGAAWAHTEWHDDLFGLDWNRTSDARFMGGGQIGVNYQFAGSHFVIGAEGQFDWVGNNNGNGVTVVGPLGHTFNVVSNDTRIATLAARFGFAFDRALFYGKVGGGWVGNNGFTVTDQNTGQVFVGDTSHTLSGWMAGVGIEYAFTDNWSAKFEYDFIGLGSRSFVVPGTVIPVLAGDTITSDHNNVQLVKFGINYRFGWGGPVVARY